MSDQKKQLGKILLKRKMLSQADLERTLAEQRSGDGLPLASRLISQGLVRESDALRGLSEQFGVPAVDLERIGIATSHLVLPEEFAKSRKVLVIFADEERALVAMASPDDALLAEVAAMSGLTASPYIALSLPLHRAIEEAYAAAKSGVETYYGRKARTSERREALLSLATFVPSGMGREDSVVFTDESLRAAAAAESIPFDRGPVAPMEAEPESVDVERLLTKGAEAFQAKRYEEAILLLQRAVRAHPSSFPARYQLGLMLGQVGQIHEAITELERATTLEPNAFSALKNLAILYEKSGFRARALASWQRALAATQDPRMKERIEAHLAKLEC